MKRKKYRIRIKIIYETSIVHEQVNMKKAKQDVSEALIDYLKNKKNILFDNKLPRIIYKVEKYDK